MTSDALVHLQADPVLAKIIAETPVIKPAVSFADVPEADRLYLALL
ncbi:MAG: DNA-3-methyladenine glycosylase 2 family protein, partial [Cytophagaceae bacterium]